MRLGLGLRLSDVVAAVRGGAVVKSTLVDGLVSYWPLGETSGTRVDVVGNNSLTDNNTVGYATNVNGNGADFEADNLEYLSCTHKASQLTGGTDFTWAGWMKNEQTNVQNVMVVKSTGASWPNRIHYYVTTDSQVRFYVANAAGDGVYNANKAKAMFADTQLFVVAWYDSTAGKIYIDIDDSGSPAEAAVAAGVFNEAEGTLCIGGAPAPVGYGDGIIDEVGFWSRALTSDERAELYNGGAGKFYNATSEDFEE